MFLVCVCEVSREVDRRPLVYDVNKCETDKYVTVVTLRVMGGVLLMG